MTCQSNRSGLTLIELIVALTVLCIAMALVVPAVQRAREHARSESCRNNLRVIGVALYTFVTADPQDRLCSGAFDPRRDGSPDTYGWVADVIKIQGGNPNELRCVANPVQGLSALNDLIERDAAEFDGSVPADRRNVGRAGAGWPELPGLPTTAGSPARTQQVARFVREGYNTNYSASWYLVRAQPQISTNHDEFFAEVHNGDYWGGMFIDLSSAPPGGDLRDLSATHGPLTRRLIERAETPSGNIPLLGDSAASAASKPLSNGLLEESGWEWLSSKQHSAGAASFSDGPAYWKVDHIQRLDQSAPIKSVVPRKMPTLNSRVRDETPFASASSMPDGQHRLVLQDTRNWYAVHGRKAHLLMADGGVKSLQDWNGDGFFNPGFPIDESIARESLQLDVGYSDSRREIDSFDVHVSALFNPKAMRGRVCILYAE